MPLVYSNFVVVRGRREEADEPSEEAETRDRAGKAAEVTAGGSNDHRDLVEGFYSFRNGSHRSLFDTGNESQRRENMRCE